MKKNWTRVLYSVFIFMFLTCFQVAAAEEITIETAKVSTGSWDTPLVSAASAVLIDAETGDVLYDKEAHKRRPPASTTKIMTAIIALELVNTDEISTVSERADRVGESTIYLDKGDKIKIGELLEGALVRSGNDACVAIAEKAAGSVEEFARLMNKKAVSIGVLNTHFVNPHGLPDKNHYSTAYDLALMARYGMQIPEFAKIVGEKFATISFEYPPKTRKVTNTNKLLWNYPYADGVKTGTTNEAGKCLVASASKEGRRLICVVLDAPDRFGDCKRLLEWGFDNTQIINFGYKGDTFTLYPYFEWQIPLALGENAVICLEKNGLQDLKTRVEFTKGIYPPIKQGKVLGYFNVYLREKKIKEIPLICEKEIRGNPLRFSGTINIVIDKILDLLDNKG